MNHEHMVKSTPIKKGVAKLEAELAKAWRDIETLSVVELAGRNASVAEHVKHWESRAIKAEAQSERDEALLLAALGALIWSDTPTYLEQKSNAVITALRARLGEKA